ncbi:MAG: hypothetical protein QOJ29_5476 [Thermoleophilaceae bacterium]|nr:hypothetical protein [Thermoleophilaceae bacterium]
MKTKHTWFAAALCAVMALAPAVPAEAAKKKRKPAPKPQYSFTYVQTHTSKSTSRCPIVTGGFTNVTTTVTETTWQSGEVDASYVSINTRQLDQKQEVENSEYVKPYDLKGDPVKTTTSGKAKEVAKIRKDKLVFTHPGFDGLTAQRTVRLPARKGDRINVPINIKVSEDPQDSGNRCTHTEESQIEGGLTVIRRR